MQKEQKYAGKRRGIKPKKQKDKKEKPPPKKRGRKPKKKPANEEKKIPKKRGRKPQNKSYGFNKNTITKNPITNDNIIIHLPIKDIYDSYNDVNNLLNYSPILNVPEPINQDTNLAFIKKDNYTDQKLQEKNEVKEKREYPKFINVQHNEKWFKDNSLEKIKQERNKEIDEIKIKIKNNSVSKTLIQFDEANKLNYWPENTKISCWWCTYQFDNVPCALPMHLSNNVYNVTGVFCSPECAAAYNFNTNGITNIWEKYSLLNLLYGKLYKTQIKIAPPRNTLKKFGGHLTIEQFRKHNVNDNLTFKIITPPLKSIIPCIECSSDTKIVKNTNVKNTSYKLQRSKPFNKNTLEECMNIIKT